MTSTDATTDITTTVREIVSAELGVAAGDLAVDRDLRAVEGADSVKVLRMIARIEQRFDVELDDSDVFGVTTVAEIATVVGRASGGTA